MAHQRTIDLVVCATKRRQLQMDGKMWHLVYLQRSGFVELKKTWVIVETRQLFDRQTRSQFQLSVGILGDVDW